MFKVDVRNYQAIKKVCLEIDKGLTVIVGKTNSGKSAIFRALDDAIFNVSTSEEKIRNNQKHAAVKIDSGKHQIIWRRKAAGKNNKTAYQIDGGDPFTKVGRLQLEEVADLLNIREVRMTNNIKEKVNFLPQGAPPFLTDKTSGQLFEFLSLSSNDNYIKVLKKINSDLSGVKSDIISTSAALDTLREINEAKSEFLEKNKGFEEVYKDTVMLNREIEDNIKIGEKKERHSIVNKKVEDREKDLKSTIKELDKIDFDKVKKEFDEVKVMAGEKEKMEKVIASLEKKEKRAGEVSIEEGVVEKERKAKERVRADAEKELKELDRLDKMVGDVAKVSERYKKREDLYNKSKGEMERVDKKRDKINDKKIDKIIKALERASGLLHDIEGRVEKLEKAEVRVKELKGKYKDADKEYKNAVTELKEYEEEIGTCPLCGNSLARGDDCGK